MAVTRVAMGELRVEVFQRDGRCIAAILDTAHRCQSRLTLEHVPKRGENALGRKAPDCRHHCATLCLGAQSAYWGERHREDERAWLAQFYPDHPPDCECPEGC